MDNFTETFYKVVGKSILGLLAVRNRSLLYLSWSLLFVYILFDDAIGLHEKLGGVISQRLAFAGLFSLRPIDLGELVVSAVAGLFFPFTIAATYRLGDRSARSASKTLTFLLFVLAFFGIAIDMLHVVLMASFLNPLLIVMEDGGELIVMRLIACFVFSQSVTQQAKQSVEQKNFVSHS
ncbi:MAG: hypothetical protein F6K28_40820 [Microcoleus sp. SIO2G3]|nr:hypothetical protein [Microcoleus sp. SIO2G3]